MKSTMNDSSLLRTGLVALTVLTSAAFLSPLSLDAAVVDAGQLSLDLGPSAPSFLGVPPSSIAGELCGTPAPGDTKDPKLLAANDGGHRLNALALEIQGAHESGDGLTISVAFKASGFTVTGDEPFGTHCGSFTYRVILDPRAGQAQAALTLHRTTPIATTGVFTGTVPVVATMEFTSMDDFEIFEFPLDLTLELQGPWAASAGAAKSPPPPRGSRVIPPPADTNLALFAIYSNGRFEAASTPSVQRSLQYAPQGQIVLQASAGSLAALNGPADW